MPRQKIIKENENEIGFIIDCLNENKNKSINNEGGYRGFYKNTYWQKYRLRRKGICARIASIKIQPKRRSACQWQGY